MANKAARERLKHLRTKRGLSIRDAGKQLGVSHVTILAWEAGRAVPSTPFREVIELWSGSQIKAASWPPSAHESLVQRKVAEFKRRSGTEG